MPLSSDKAHLVVVSNRVALPGSTQTGGLATALQAALEDRGGIWADWSGEISDGPPAATEARGVRYLTRPLGEREHRAYYLGFANRVLWPLLHSRMDLVEYERSEYLAYLEANRRFAELILPHLRDDSVVWIHDYHLFPLAGILREQGVRNRIGFFLHTPFPAPDLVRCLPHHEALFAGLARNDVVGLQTRRDADHLGDYLRAHTTGAASCRASAPSRSAWTRRRWRRTPNDRRAWRRASACAPACRAAAW